MYGFLKRFIHHHNQLDWQIYNWIIEEDVKRCDRYRIFFHNKKRKLEIVWYKQSKKMKKTYHFIIYRSALFVKRIATRISIIKRPKRKKRNSSPAEGFKKKKYKKYKNET